MKYIFYVLNFPVVLFPRYFRVICQAWKFPVDKMFFFGFFFQFIAIVSMRINLISMTKQPLIVAKT